MDSLCDRKSDTSQLTEYRRPESNQLIVFESPAAEYFSQRTFKGLNAEVAAEERSLSILPGKMGIAKGYVSMK